jgi:hypothetical protein
MNVSAPSPIKTLAPSCSIYPEHRVTPAEAERKTGIRNHVVQASISGPNSNNRTVATESDYRVLKNYLVGSHFRNKGDLIQEQKFAATGKKAAKEEVEALTETRSKTTDTNAQAEIDRKLQVANAKLDSNSSHEALMKQSIHEVDSSLESRTPSKSAALGIISNDVKPSTARTVDGLIEKGRGVWAEAGWGKRSAIVAGSLAAAGVSVAGIKWLIDQFSGNSQGNGNNETAARAYEAGKQAGQQEVVAALRARMAQAGVQGQPALTGGTPT